MIDADEIERAIILLDNLPAYYRDHIPNRAKDMHERLHKQTWTPVQYKELYDCNLDSMANYWPARADITANILRTEYANGSTPNLMEYAPGSFWLPYLLNKRGLAFTYQHIGLDGPPKELAVPQPTGKELVNVFVAFEIIEHLSNHWEIYQNYLKLEKPAKHVIMSTPLYTYAGGMNNWQTRELGHLRAYTPREFLEIAAKMFKNRQWKAWTDDTIVICGTLESLPGVLS